MDRFQRTVLENQRVIMEHLSLIPIHLRYNDAVLRKRITETHKLLEENKEGG